MNLRILKLPVKQFFRADTERSCQLDRVAKGHIGDVPPPRLIITHPATRFSDRVGDLLHGHLAQPAIIREIAYRVIVAIPTVIDEGADGAIAICPLTVCVSHAAHPLSRLICFMFVFLSPALAGRGGMSS